MIVRRGWPDGRSPNAAMAAIFCLSTSASRLLPRASALTASEAASDAAVRAIAMHGWLRTVQYPAQLLDDSRVLLESRASDILERLEPGQELGILLVADLQ